VTAPFRIGNSVTLYLGDCREILPTLDRAGALITDPPYGVNLGNHGGAQDGRSDHVLVKPGYASYEDTEDNLIEIVVPAVKDALSRTDRGLVFCAGQHVWHYPRADYLGGIYIPAAQGRNKWGFSSFQHCLLYGRAPALHLGAKATGIASNATSDVNGHPCPKPLPWMLWALELASLEGETVLDPFMGSGTTGVAAVKRGRQFIGIEMEPRYFDIACKRIEEAHKQGDLFRAPEKPKQAKLQLDSL
jgi:site-specific DNA-methyltransferase (adenine-specific)/modification methylase